MSGMSFRGGRSGEAARERRLGAGSAAGADLSHGEVGLRELSYAEGEAAERAFDVYGSSDKDCPAWGIVSELNGRGLKPLFSLIPLRGPLRAALPRFALGQLEVR